MSAGVRHEAPVAGGQSQEQKLTARERAVYERRADGESVAGIADGLGVTQRTVRFHLENVYAKLGITGGSAAARQLALARRRERERGGAADGAAGRGALTASSQSEAGRAAAVAHSQSEAGRGAAMAPSTPSH